MAGFIERCEARFMAQDGERTRSARILADPQLDIFTGPNGADGLEDILADTAEAAGMRLVLLGHVNESVYTAVATYTRDPALAFPQGSLIPIGETYCREEITADRPFVLGDATLYERFLHHPGYTKHGLRSYAGAPVTLPDGTLFGTLCAVDTGPSLPSLKGVEKLIVLAKEAGRRIGERLAGRA